MKHWEDIVKDKLEGYEKPLPEGSLARFRNRRTAAAATPEPDHAPASKRSPLPWVLAAAAALAAVLLLAPPRNSVHPEENLLSNQHPTPPATTVADSVKVSDTENVDARQHHQLVAHTDMTNANRQNPVRPQAPTAAARPKELTSAVRPQSPEAIGTATQTGQTGNDGAPEAIGTTTHSGQDGNDGAPEAIGTATYSGQAGNDGAPEANGSATQSNQDGNDGAPEAIGTASHSVQAGNDGAPEAIGTATQTGQAGNGGAPEEDDAPSATSTVMPQEPAASSRQQDATAAARPKEPTSAVRPQAQAKDEVPSAPATDDAGVGTTGLPATSPFVPEPETISGKVVPAAIGVAGSGALMGAVTAIAPLLVTKDYGYESFSNDDRLKRGPSHYMPLKMGLSVRLPIAARLSITTGVDYSLYFSRLEYVKTGTKNQTVHALSIPLRLDGTLAHNRWLDVYVGAGLEGSYCVGVHQNGYLDGQRLYKDIFDVSIVGAGGIQYNLTKQLGLYVEPQLSLMLKGQDNNLPTYRTANPLMFCVSTGFRYTFR